MNRMSDDRYLEIILNRVRISADYRPKFGQSGRGLDYAEFKTLYGSDPFYTWFGLDVPLMYAAHRAAGGITSVYRQIGTGCEELFRQIIQDQTGLATSEVNWSYDVESAGLTQRHLALDARIPLNAVSDAQRYQLLADWLNAAAGSAGVAEEIRQVLGGAVFEVRQGYKSKDSKRQNADIANAASAYSQGYLPVVAMLSTQIDSDVARRYQRANILLLRGQLEGSALTSTYIFCREVLGYDLAGFFERHADTLRANIQQILETLLSPDE